MKELRCDKCGIFACKAAPGTEEYPDSCPMRVEQDLLFEAEGAYLDDEQLHRYTLAAARTEAGGYCVEPRVEEIMSFAGRLDAKRLGVASCIGLMRESHILCRILTANQFEVRCVGCKVGSIDKEKIGIKDEEKIRPGQYESMCNPIGQAMLLNDAGTELNIAVGLCVGHDSIFFKHSEAPVTVLIAKDRVTGHNPAAALYTAHSYYRRLKNE
ncbi:MAG: DUF1847 domain-containing protein [Deltaproteobacteria bacterium]|nr:DUF1847 domain-containing protein [Deltaproteobacteria bacterium]